MAIALDATDGVVYGCQAELDSAAGLGKRAVWALEEAKTWNEAG